MPSTLAIWCLSHGLSPSRIRHILAMREKRMRSVAGPALAIVFAASVLEGCASSHSVRSAAPTTTLSTQPSSGMQCVGPSRTETDARGAVFYYFSDPVMGIESWQVQPPPDFDPATASDA